MFDVGLAELVFLAIIGMVVIGPERLPAVARTVGKAVGTARRLLYGLQTQLEQEIKLEELNRKIMAETEDQASAAENTIHSPAPPAAGDAPASVNTSDNTTEEVNERN